MDELLAKHSDAKKLTHVNKYIQKAFSNPMVSTSLFDRKRIKI